MSCLRGHEFDAVGIASFGPVELNKEKDTYGCILNTPKPHWSMVNVMEPFKVFKVPVGFAVDVGAAALGELKHGRHGYGLFVTYCRANQLIRRIETYRRVCTLQSELEWV